MKKVPQGCVTGMVLCRQSFGLAKLLCGVLIFAGTACLAQVKIQQKDAFSLPGINRNWRDTISYAHDFNGGLCDRNGKMWFVSDSRGIFCYDPVTQDFTNYSARQGLCSDKVRAIYEDRAGNLWIATEAGICFYDGRSFSSVGKFKGLDVTDINLIREDKAGRIWMGSNSRGVYRYDPRADIVLNFTKAHGLGSNSIQCILEDSAGVIWVGERAGGVSRYDSTTAGFTSFDGKGCLSNQIMGMIQDRTGDLWFANLYHGLCRYNGETFTHLEEEQGLCDNTVTCLYEDGLGNIWFGSDPGQKGDGGGLCRYNANRFTRFNEDNGLSRHHLAVWTITGDREGNIWIGTKQGGLYRYDGSRMKNFTGAVNKL